MQKYIEFCTTEKFHNLHHTIMYVFYFWLKGFTGIEKYANEVNQDGLLSPPHSSKDVGCALPTWIK